MIITIICSNNFTGCYRNTAIVYYQYTLPYLQGYSMGLCQIVMLKDPPIVVIFCISNSWLPTMARYFCRYKPHRDIWRCWQHIRIYPRSNSPNRDAATKQPHKKHISGLEGHATFAFFNGESPAFFGHKLFLLNLGNANLKSIGFKKKIVILTK